MKKLDPISRDGITLSEYDSVAHDGLLLGMKLDEKQVRYYESIGDDDVKVVFCEAPAGSGKTTLAFAAADRLVKVNKSYEGIIYMMAPYGEQRQGYLPGSITEKSEVYFEPAYQAMLKCGINPYVAVSKESLTDRKYDDSYITLLTNTFIRGTNFENKVVIIDEAQNFTEHELRTAISRIHDSCKLIVIGHDLQCDLKDYSMSGFAKCRWHFRVNYPDITSVCWLTENYRGKISKAADEIWEVNA